MVMPFCLSVCLSVRSFVRLSVAWEICQVIRYAAAPGGERGLIESTPVQVFYLLTGALLLCI